MIINEYILVGTTILITLIPFLMLYLIFKQDDENK